MDYSMIKTLKRQVEQILQDFPETRNSDIALMIQIWRSFYNIGTAIHVDDLYWLPREDNIKRARAYFQNDKGLYLPTDLAIAQRRGILEDEWRVAMGYPIRRAIENDQPSFTPPSEIGKILPNNPLF